MPPRGRNRSSHGLRQAVAVCVDTLRAGSRSSAIDKGRVLLNLRDVLQGPDAPEVAAMAVRGGVVPPVVELLASPNFTKTLLLDVLLNLARNDPDNCRAAIVAAGGVPIIIELMRGEPYAVALSSGLLGLRTPENQGDNQGPEDDQQRAFTAAGGVAALLEVMQDPSHGGANDAVYALSACAYTAVGANAIAAAGGIPIIGRQLDDPATGGLCLSSLVMMARHGRHVAQIVRTGALRKFAAAARAAHQRRSPERRDFFLTALHGIASWHEFRAEVAACGVVPFLLQVCKRDVVEGPHIPEELLLLLATDERCGQLRREMATRRWIAFLVAWWDQDNPTFETDLALRALALQIADGRGALVASVNPDVPFNAFQLPFRELSDTGLGEGMVRRVRRKVLDLISESGRDSSTTHGGEPLLPTLALTAVQHLQIALRCPHSQANVAHIVRSITVGKPEVAAAIAAVPKWADVLIALVARGTPLGQRHAAGALANMVLGSAERCAVVVEKGGAKALVRLLRAGKPLASRIAAARALRALSSAGGPAARAAIVEARGVEELLALIRDCRGAPGDRAAAVKALRRLGSSPSARLRLLQLQQRASQGGLPQGLLEEMGLLYAQKLVAGCSAEALPSSCRVS